MIYSSAVSNKGLIRSNNEDNILFYGECIPEKELNNYSVTNVNALDFILAAVFDGMGGQNAGEKASLTAAVCLMPYYERILSDYSNLNNNVELLIDYVEKANKLVYELGEADESKHDMGTTFACLYISGKRLVALNIGDSRIYIYKNNSLIQISEDHTEAERLVRIGVITRENSRGHKGRNILCRYLGVNPDEGVMEASINKDLVLEGGDIFLLCSDGLTDMLTDEEITKIIQSSNDTEKVSSLLVEAALQKGGKDNVTVITVMYLETLGTMKIEEGDRNVEG